MLLHADLLGFQLLHFKALALAGCLSGRTVPENTLNATLLLFIFGLGSFPVGQMLEQRSRESPVADRYIPRRKIGLGHWEFLTPGLSLLRGLLLVFLHVVVHRARRIQ